MSCHEIDTSLVSLLKEIIKSHHSLILSYMILDFIDIYQ